MKDNILMAASTLPFLSPNPSKAHSVFTATTTTTGSKSHFIVRCGRRSLRPQLVKGRVLSIEAIQAVQSLKRAHRGGDQTRIDVLISRTFSRLIKADLIATFNELLRQDQCDLALRVFSAVRSELWYKTDLNLYAALVGALARNGMTDDIDHLIIEDLEAEEGVIPCDKGLVRLIQALILSGRADSIAKVYGLMKRSGWRPTSAADDYLAKVLSEEGLKNLENGEVAEGISMEIGRLYEDILGKFRA